jgi:hypothetical protein
VTKFLPAVRALVARDRRAFRPYLNSQTPTFRLERYQEKFGFCGDMCRERKGSEKFLKGILRFFMFFLFLEMFEEEEELFPLFRIIKIKRGLSRSFVYEETHKNTDMKKSEKAKWR